MSMFLFHVLNLPVAALAMANVTLAIGVIVGFSALFSWLQTRTLRQRRSGAAKAKV